MRSCQLKVRSWPGPEQLKLSTAGSKLGSSGPSLFLIIGLSFRIDRTFGAYQVTAVMQSGDRSRLVGSSVVLRSPVESDIDARLQHGKHPEVARMYGSNASTLAPITRKDAVDWFDRIRSNPNAWVIDNGCTVGAVHLTITDEVNKSASLAIGIFAPTWLGKGLGTEAVRLVLNYAFQVLELHRVSVRVLAFNERALRVYQKCGFVTEGRLRETVYVDGEWHDYIVMSILAAEHHLNDLTVRVYQQMSEKSEGSGRLDDIFDAWNQGLVGRRDFAYLILPELADDNIDAVTAKLPDEIRSQLLKVAAYVCPQHTSGDAMMGIDGEQICDGKAVDALCRWAERQSK